MEPVHGALYARLILVNLNVKRTPETRRQGGVTAPEEDSSSGGSAGVAEASVNAIRPPDAQFSERWLVALCAGIGALVLWADIQLPKGVAMGVPHVLVILFSLRIGDGRVTYGFALVCTFLTLLGFHFSPANVGGQNADPWMVLMNRLVALLAIWSAAFIGIRFKNLVVQQKALLTEKELALQEIKILKGQLPICAHCKRIRDAQDNWLQLEEYLLDHSEARFSHGICPECLEKNFPEYLNR